MPKLIETGLLSMDVLIFKTFNAVVRPVGCSDGFVKAIGTQHIKYPSLSAEYLANAICRLFYANLLKQWYPCLLKRSLAGNGMTVLSMFVNAAQFAPRDNLIIH